MSTRASSKTEFASVQLDDKGIQKWAVAEDKSAVAENDPVRCVSRASLGGTSDPKAIGRAGHQAQVDDLCLAIAEDREPMIAGASARKAVELILAIYASSQSGKEVYMADFVAAAAQE